MVALAEVKRARTGWSENIAYAVLRSGEDPGHGEAGLVDHEVCGARLGPADEEAAADDEEWHRCSSDYEARKEVLGRKRARTSAHSSSIRLPLVRGENVTNLCLVLSGPLLGFILHACNSVETIA
jgi:hypothetical protein